MSGRSIQARLARVADLEPGLVERRWRREGSFNMDATKLNDPANVVKRPS